MIKKYLILNIIVFMHLFAQAQYKSMLNGNLNQKSNRLEGKLTGTVYYLSPVSNTNYFLQKDWTEGTITLKDGDRFDGVKMRYLAYGDELVTYNESNHCLFIVDKNTVKEFTFRATFSVGTVVERKFVNLDSLNLPFKRSYFELLFSGKTKLLAFHQIDVRKVSPYTDTRGQMFDVEFHPLTIYYLLAENKGLSKIQLKNRSIYSIYPGKKKEIKKMLKKNKISINNEVSAAKAIEILDSSGLIN